MIFYFDYLVGVINSTIILSVFEVKCTYSDTWQAE